jgi:hypothetical protein
LNESLHQPRPARGWWSFACEQPITDAMLRALGVEPMSCLLARIGLDEGVSSLQD